MPLLRGPLTAFFLRRKLASPSTLTCWGDERVRQPVEARRCWDPQGPRQRRGRKHQAILDARLRAGIIFGRLRLLNEAGPP